MAYVSQSRGAKGGGFNQSTPDQTQLTTVIRPETLDTTEAGIKSQWLEKRLQVNASGFYYEYSEIQLPTYNPGGGIAYTNAPKARIWGLDLDAEAAVTNQLTLIGGIEYMEPTFTWYPGANYEPPVNHFPFGDCFIGSALTPCLFNAKGQNIPYSPRLSGNIGANYRIEIAQYGTFIININDAYVGRYYAGPTNVFSQSPYNDLSGTVAWELPGERVELRLWGRNLLDDKYAPLIVESTSGHYAIYAPPRTYGFELEYDF